MTCARFIATGVNRMLMATLRQDGGADGGTIGTIMIFAIILVLVAAVIFFAQRYKRCPPDQVMAVSYTHLTLPTILRV